MTQVIIYKNPELGNVCVCSPSGELPIEEILAKDCPSGAIIVDDSTLPQGYEAKFFDSWELNGTNVIVNFSKAQAERLKDYNHFTLKVIQKRQLNTLAGIDNLISDEDFQTKLTADRAAIALATTISELIAIQNPQE